MFVFWLKNELFVRIDIFDTVRNITSSAGENGGGIETLV
jgi:hypothetical protein